MLTKEQLNAFVKEREIAKAKSNEEQLEALLNCYAGKSSSDLLQIVQQAQNNWAQIHCAQFNFADLSEGFGAYTVGTGNTVSVVVPLSDGSIISAKHLPKTTPSRKVIGFKITDYTKQKILLEGGREVYSTRVQSVWVYEPAKAKESEKKSE